MSLVIMHLSVCPTITAHVQRSAFPHIDCSSTQKGITHREQVQKHSADSGKCARGWKGELCKGLWGVVKGKHEEMGWGRLAILETAEKQGRDLRSRPVHSVVGFGQTLKFSL